MSEKTGNPTIDADNAKFAQLQAKSDKAQGLVGKLFKLPRADGYAFYTVEEEKGQQVRIKHQALGDAWQDSILGLGGWFPRKQIEPIIRREEGMAKVLENAARKQDIELASLTMMVAAAADTDLGTSAGVYELANWCWARGFRGTVKDGRVPIASNRAGDIASAMLKSGRFPALKSLKDDIAFIMLADSFKDPLVYKNLAPSDDVVLGKVMEAFLKAVGTDRVNLKLAKSDSKYLDNTYLTIFNQGGVKVGSVCYDPKDGKILQINVAFKMNENGKVEAQ